MSERKAKAERRERAQFLQQLFGFTKEEFKEKERNDSTMKHVLAMNKKEFSAFLVHCVEQKRKEME